MILHIYEGNTGISWCLEKKQLKNKACTQTQIGNKTVMEYACVLNSWNIGVSYFRAVNAICERNQSYMYVCETIQVLNPL